MSGIGHAVKGEEARSGGRRWPGGLRSATIGCGLRWRLTRRSRGVPGSGQLGAADPLHPYLHWVDPSTLELLGLLAEQGATAPLLLLFTTRPEFSAPWPSRAHHAQMTLNRLSRREARALVTRVAGETPLPADTVETLVQRTDGVPLFIEELTRLVLQRGAGVVGGRDGAAVREIPATLEDSLRARLDQLGPARDVAQVAAVIGREFSYALLQAVLPLRDPELQAALDALASEELIYTRGLPPEATYLFKHALVQEAAYAALLRSRRRELHRAIARALSERFPAIAEEQPEVLGHHYAEAGEIEPAIVHYQRAGERAAARSAYEEATVYLRRAIQLLATLPASAERDGREAQLQLALGASLIAVRGYSHPETEAAYDRAVNLCDAVGDVVQRASALAGLCNFYIVRGELGRGFALAERILELVRETGEDVPLVLGHEGVAIVEFVRGEFASALKHSEQAAAIYDPSRHQVTTVLPGADQGVAVRDWAAASLWCLGYPDRALERAREAIDMARSLAQPFSLCHALYAAANLHWFRRDVESQRELTDQLIALGETQGFSLWLAAGKIHRGATLAISGAGGIAVAEVVEGLTLWGSIGHQLTAPEALALLAGVQQAAGQLAEALGVTETALAVAEQTGQRFWDAELHRQKGELLLQSQAGSEAEAEQLFRRALEIARAQEARSFELRAATSMARLWHCQGKDAEARALLAPVYGWFTEGFDTRDLVEAKALLEELG